MKLYSKVCFGLVLFLVCPDDKPPLVVSDYCGNTEILRPAKGESKKLTEGLRRQLLAHNRKRDRLCSDAPSPMKNK